MIQLYIYIYIIFQILFPYQWLQSIEYDTLCYTVGPCPFSILYVCALSHSVVSTLCDPMDCSQPGSSVHGIFSGKNTGVGCHFLLQGIFLPQGLNPCLLCLLHCR